jgi:nitrate/TMAO reductase-like tetraheme cytochrome c subunit
MEVVKIHMKKAMIVLMFVLAVAGFVMAQNYVSPTDVLGAHQNQGRGCAGCHAPHSGAFGSGHTPKGSAADTGSYALWGQDASPLYGATLAFGDSGRYVEVLPTTISTGATEVGGILLCLSCHDGNVTYSNMMQDQSYEQQIGLLTNTTYGSGKIPTLLGNDGTTAGNYTNDHPVGQNANISSGSGLVWANNAFTVTAGSQFAQFVTNYGWPALAPGKWSAPYGVTASGKPYVVCTTCHNQHVMTVYTASANSPIAGQTTGYYATFFFVNGPYNPNNQNKASLTQAYSTTQFCRQCHFSEANEANNTNNITTLF